MAYEDCGSLIRIWQNMTIMAMDIATDIATDIVTDIVMVTVTRCWRLGLWILAAAGILNSAMSLARSVFSGELWRINTKLEYSC